MAKRVKTLMADPELQQRAINTIRVLAADTVEAGKSGHPGAPMGCAPMAYQLWANVMNYNPANPKWFGRDRFVLSNGHACALQYVMLHLTGYASVPMADLKLFRQLGSATPGHPENFHTAGVEVSTGPLGQGISNAVGLAIAERHLGAKYNIPGEEPVLDNFTYVICGDGCLQEGVSSEASSLAGHLQLGKLIVLYDDNKITIDGSTDLSFTEDVLKRYEAYGWHCSVVEDGNTTADGIAAAVEAAKAVTNAPSIIKIRTVIGFGSGKAGTHGVHGAPLGASDLASVKERFGFNPAEAFVVPEDVGEMFRQAGARGAAKEAAWNERLTAYIAAHPEQGNELARRIAGELPAGFEAALPVIPADAKADATRNWSGKALIAAATAIPEIVGGSADLAPSNKTELKGVSGDFQAATPDGRYFRFGVREHGMFALSNGMAAYGGIIPYAATFLNFIMYGIGAVRLSALSRFQVIYVMTHDSIGLGEDGPTHQPVECLASLRSMPNMTVVRPADGNEVSGAYSIAIKRREGPTVICLSRQGLPNLAASSVDHTQHGGYTVYESSESKSDGRPDLVIVATGSEVGIAIDGAKAIAGKTVRVVSMPCLELWDSQPLAYRQSIIPDGVPVLSVEASATWGWERYSHAQIGLKEFGRSGPIKDLYNFFNITPEAVAAKGSKMIAHFATAPVPSLYLPTFD